MINQKRRVKIWESLCLLGGMTGIILYSMLVLKLDAHMPILLSAVLAGLWAKSAGYTWKEIRDGIMDSNIRALEAYFIVMCVGMLIGSWMLSGVVPSMVYYGLKVVSPKFFLPTGALLCALVSLATGSSWTAAGTVGVALMGIGLGLGVDPAMTAGMIVSGSFFGDKLSPLSDSSNVAAATVETDLYTHVRGMLYTTLPSFIIALGIYAVISWNYDASLYQGAMIAKMSEALHSSFHITPWCLLPPLLLLWSAKKGIPAIPSLLGAAALGGLWAIFIQDASLMDVFASYQNGYVSNTGFTMLDTLLTRGGFQTMMWTISLMMLALSLGGILETAGFTEVILEKLVHYVHSVGSAVALTIFTGIACDFALSDQYLANMLPGRMYYKLYDDMGLARHYLSRTLEDGGTLWAPMFPWNGGGAYLAMTLGVPTFTYFPYAFLNLINPILAILFAYAGIFVFWKSSCPVGKIKWK